METVLIVIHVVCSFLLVVAILLQSGKGGGLAAGFGGAGAGTQVFGGAGAGGFLSKATIGLAAIFMSTSLALAYISSQPRSAMSLEGGAATGNQEEKIIDQGGAGGNGAAAPAADEAGQDEAGQDEAAPIMAPTGDAPAEGGDEAAAPAEEPAAGDEAAGEENSE
jgi:preprotein translocase subunit SecG